MGSTLLDLLGGENALNAPKIRAAFPTNELEFKENLQVLIGKGIEELERGGKRFEALGEDGLTHVLLTFLKGSFLHVSTEEFSKGHADLTIRDANQTFLAIGEAKVYRAKSGPNYVGQAIEQLIGYLTGRETFGFTVIYYRVPGIETTLLKIREWLDRTLPGEQQEPCSELPIKWTLESIHTHPSGGGPLR